MSHDRRAGRLRASSVFRAFLAAGLAAAGSATGPSTAVLPAAGDPLEAGFKDPPHEARPRVWWHWMNGNVTKEGITADLEWMKRVGIGGLQMFDGSLGTPVLVERRLVWMTAEWKDAFRHTAAEADRLGLEMAMAASGGWSETGGPWVKPEEAMKKVVWSETRVEGPRRFAGKLPNPPSVNGGFQDIPAPPPFELPQPPPPRGARPQPKPPPPPPDPTHYADTAVIAYRVPEDEVRMADQRPNVTTSGEAVDAAVLLDGDLNKQVALSLPQGGQPAWVQIEFREPFRAHAFSIATGAPASPFGGESIPQGALQAGADGSRFVTLVTLPGPSHPFAGFPVRTYSFPETTARFFRVVLREPPRSPFAEFFGTAPAREFKLAELELHSTPRVDRWEGKAAFGNMADLDSVPTPDVPPALAIARQDVIDLTSRMRRDGSLDWDVPAGRWVILRLGYSLTGHKNGPASREATGYEVDKLSGKHVRSYLGGYLGPIAAALGPYLGKSFRYLLMDSWEAGLQNWTDDMLGEFRRRRGYDPTPFLPVLTGRVVGGADESDRFLWDFRRTIADLIAESHYQLAAEDLRERGLGLYAEAMGAGLPVTADALQDKGRVDIPMGEFWVRPPGAPHSPEHPSDVREAASAAHVYGKAFVAVEAFTTGPPMSGWQPPSYLKPFADYYFAQGMNRIVFHTSDHQPFVDEKHKPGITLGPFGQHYTRNNTWAEQSAAWNAYLSRCSFLLQQGLFVGDLAYYYGEGAPIAVPFWKKVRPEPPAGYDHDYVNTEVLTRMSVKDGRLVLPGGMSYRVLVLPEDVDRLTLPVVRKIRDLVADGATVIAPRPGKSPSLAGYPSADEEIRAVASEVWGGIDGRSVTGHAYGKGRVRWGVPPGEVLAALETEPDFLYNRPHIDTTLVFIHRRVADGEIYFVANQQNRTEEVETSFRVEGKEAELWHPDTGVIEPAAYRIANGRTSVPLRLDPLGSVFVVFRRSAAAPSRTLSPATRTVLATVAGPWTLRFPPNWGAPPEVTLERLESWTDSPEAGVKHFSGTATYAKDVQAPAAWFRPGGDLVLDLGEVKEIAEVSVNGRLFGVLWKPPFRVDVTGALKEGPNRLEIKVTNLWTNRMIGDQELPPEKRYSFSTYNPYDRSAPLRRGGEVRLLESGLLGPVTLWNLTR